MNAGPDVLRQISEWLDEEAPARAPDRILTSTALVIDHTKQRRAWRTPWRSLTMNRTAQLLGAAAAVVVVVVAGIALLGRSPSNVSGPAAPTPSPSQASVSSQSPSIAPIGKLIPFTSDIYGYSIDYPEKWVVRKATRVLSGPEPPLDTSAGVDHFTLPLDRYGESQGGPHGTIVIGSAEVAPGTTLETWTSAAATALCGAVPTPEDIEIDGESGSLLTIPSCNGLVYAIWATALHGTSGFYVVFFDDPGTEASDRANFEEILATFTFPRSLPATPAPS
jgi:hypothetical protein